MKDTQDPKGNTQEALTAQPQKSYREDFVVASTEEIMTAFLESEPQYENL